MTGTCRRLLSWSMIVLTATACGEPEPASDDVTTIVAKPIERANLDTTCAACKDFYQFANGGWLKATPIPAAYPTWGSFIELSDRNETVLHRILDEASADVASKKVAVGTDRWKVGAFYGACMDTASIETRGLASLQPVLAKIAAISSPVTLASSLGVLEHDAGLAPWSNGSEQDPKNATVQIAALGQGGLSLPEREYYLKTDSASTKLRDAFTAHVSRIFQLLGDSASVADVEAKTVLAFETQLAQASKSAIALRDPIANYHKMTLAELQALAPRINWLAFYKSQGAPAIPAVDVAQPAYFKTFNEMITSVPIADWKTVLRWRAAHETSSHLTSAFVNENFKFQQILTGSKELLPRWKRCVRVTDARIGELLGQEYVARTFPPAAKARAIKIVETLVDELHARIEHLEWMSQPTKVQALAKLSAFQRKIGYPDQWRDYTTLTVTPDDNLGNVLAANQFEVVRNWKKIGQPINRAEWGMTPPTVNAYYNPQLNEIVFPAGILQAPFYDPEADDAVNYGAMGAVIGHEMTHGFDDQGRQYDKSGNLTDWWSKEDAAKYNVEAKKVVDQFDAYTVLDNNTHVKGALTLGENLADFGGLTVAYSAMKRAQGGKAPALIDGFSAEQRFFLGWAQVWRSVERDAYQRMTISADPHAPSKWRVNGPFSNMPEFQQAWGCKDGDAMVRAAVLRPRIW